MYLPLNIIVGAPQSDGVQVVIVSHANTPVTVTCNSSTWSSPADFAMSAVGTDRGSGPAQAGFVGTLKVQVTGAPLERFSGVVTQGQDQVAFSFRLAPHAKQDFTVFFGTCDRAGAAGDGFTFMAEVDQDPDALPVACFIHSDDIQYLDRRTFDDTAETGHSTTGKPESTLKEYDYAVNWLYWLGMIGAGYDRYGEVNRLHVRNHINFAPNYGNHDIVSILGTFADVAIPNGMHATPGGRDGVGVRVYDQFLAPLQPPFARNRDPIANLWALDLGPVRFVAMDDLINATSTTLFGTNQILDTLDALNTDQPFKVLITNNTPRDPGNPADLSIGDPVSGYLGHYPIDLNVPLEYSRLFVDNTAVPNSVMANDKTNGLLGHCVCLVGDYHNASVGWCHRPAGGSDLAENFYEIHVGSIGGTIPHLFIDGLSIQDGPQPSYSIEAAEGYDSNDVLLEYQFKNDYVSSFTNDAIYVDERGTQRHVVQVDVYGSKSPPEMHIKLLREDRYKPGKYNLMWSRKFVQWLTDNGGVDVAVPVSRPGSAAMAVNAL